MNFGRDQIGIFDSGLGGLTVMRKIKKKLPNENLIYFGDTARVPYGGRSPETIIRYSIECSIFLMEQQIKLLVIACNTVSAHAVHKLKSIFNIPVIDVIEPGAEKAAETTINKRIAVLGTKATIQSGAYQREIHKRLSDAYILPLACPLFVPLVEENFLNHPATELIIAEYLKPIKNQNIDTVLLGCTHYPVLKHLIQKELGNGITLVDSASTCAEKVAEIIDPRTDPSPSFCRYVVTDDPDKFQLLGKEFLGESLPLVEKYTQAELIPF